VNGEEVGQITAKAISSSAEGGKRLRPRKNGKGGGVLPFVAVFFKGVSWSARQVP